MIKNILILVAVALLVLTVSNLSPISVQKENIEAINTLENKNFDASNGEELIKFVMRSLWVTQRRYICLSDTGCAGYADNFSQLTKTRLIDFEIIDGEFGGYQFEMNVLNSDNEPWLNDFEIKATPVNYSKKTARSFYIGNYNFLRGADLGGKPADENAAHIEF